jgi:hypothetical protein
MYYVTNFDVVVLLSSILLYLEFELSNKIVTVLLYVDVISELLSVANYAITFLYIEFCQLT